MSDFDKLRALAKKNKKTISGQVNRILRDYLSTLDANLEETGTEKELELQAEVRKLKGRLEAEGAQMSQTLSIYSKRQNVLFDMLERLDPDFDRSKFIREAGR